MSDKIEEVLMGFLMDASKIAKNNQKNLDISKSYKKNRNAASIVTETDIAISDLFKKTLDEELYELDYIIIDEEKLAELGEDKWKTITSSEYQFILDPIDGTLPYSLGIPMYGISVGVLKKGKPYTGFLMCPSINELVYHNGKETLWFKDAFTDEETVQKLKKTNFDSKIIFDNPWSINIHDEKLKNGDLTVNYYSAVVHLMYLASNRAKAYYMAVYLWDMAGSWAILHDLGFGIFNIKNGEPLTELSKENFTDKLQLKPCHVACKEENLEYLQNIVSLRNEKMLS